MSLANNGILANFGTISATGATAVNMGTAGSSRVVFGAGAAFGGIVTAGGASNTLELAANVGIGDFANIGRQRVEHAACPVI